MVDLDNLSDEELEKEIAETGEAFKRNAQAKYELNRRRAEKEDEENLQEAKKQEQVKKEWFASKEFQVIKDRYLKCREALDGLTKKRGVTINIPVIFTITPSVYKPNTLDYCLDEDDLKGEVSAKIGATPGLDRKQRKILEIGIKQVVDNACDELLCLFPGLNQEAKATMDEWNKLCKDANNASHTIYVEDLQEAKKGKAKGRKTPKAR